MVCFLLQTVSPSNPTCKVFILIVQHLQIFEFGMLVLKPNLACLKRWVHARKFQPCGASVGKDLTCLRQGTYNRSRSVPKPGTQELSRMTKTAETTCTIKQPTSAHKHLTYMLALLATSACFLFVNKRRHDGHVCQSHLVQARVFLILKI